MQVEQHWKNRDSVMGSSCRQIPYGKLACHCKIVGIDKQKIYKKINETYRKDN